MRKIKSQRDQKQRGSEPGAESASWIVPPFTGPSFIESASWKSTRGIHSHKVSGRGRREGEVSRQRDFPPQRVAEPTAGGGRCAAGCILGRIVGGAAASVVGALGRPDEVGAGIDRV